MIHDHDTRFACLINTKPTFVSISESILCLIQYEDTSVFVCISICICVQVCGFGYTHLRICTAVLHLHLRMGFRTHHFFLPIVFCFRIASFAKVVTDGISSYSTSRARGDCLVKILPPWETHDSGFCLDGSSINRSKYCNLFTTGKYCEIYFLAYFYLIDIFGWFIARIAMSVITWVVGFLLFLKIKDSWFLIFFWHCNSHAIITLRPSQDIFQTFLNAFSWMKTYEFWLRFHWSLFVRVQLTTFPHWFK